MSLPQPSLTQLAGQPELSLTIRGKTYLFSELRLKELVELQKWLQENTPHPIDQIKGRLDGLSDQERMTLLSEARHDAKDWPPQVGDRDGARLLITTLPGQIEALYVGLKNHHPEVTRDEIFDIYRALERYANRCNSEIEKKRKDPSKNGAPEHVNQGAQIISTIYSTLFGNNLGLYEDEEKPILKKV